MKMNKKSIALILITGIIFITSGCGSLSKPDIDDIKKPLEAKIKNESKGIIELVDIQKINGKDLEVNGTKAYQITYKYKVKFNKDCYKVCDRLSPLFRDYKVYENDPFEDNMLTVSMYRKEHYKKDQVQEIQSQKTFEYTDNGWK
jgi:hypothetical protein